MNLSADGFVYHERQQNALCGQHALNNLLQGSYFTAADLSEIALELDEMERQMMLEMGSETPEALKFLAEASGNVDEAGNFSIQVLSRALERSHEMTLSNAASESLADRKGEFAATDDAFVLNRAAHWFTVRKMYGVYWNLNSMLERPELISDFYLSAFLAQLRQDGYDVFVVQPCSKLPPPPTVDVTVESGAYPNPFSSYFRASTLLAPSTDSGRLMNSNAKDTDPWANLGSGYSLRSKPPADESTEISSPSGPASSVSASPPMLMDEDEQLAAALRASVADAMASASLPNTDGKIDTVDGISRHDDDDDELARAIAMSMESKSVTSSASGIDMSSSSNSSSDSRSSSKVDVLKGSGGSDGSFSEPIDVPPEPGDNDPSTRILVRGPHVRGKLTRRFSPDDPAACLFAWIESAKAADGTPVLNITGGQSYSLIFQREQLERASILASEKSIEDLGLLPSAALTLHVE